jgi:hypothetical protein
MTTAVARTIAIVIAVALLGAVMFSAHQCTASGGIVVRGLWWLECIRP